MKHYSNGVLKDGDKVRFKFVLVNTNKCKNENTEISYEIIRIEEDVYVLIFKLRHTKKLSFKERSIVKISEESFFFSDFYVSL